MVLGYRAVCQECDYETSNPLDFRCPCDSVLELVIEEPFRREKIAHHEMGMWRYVEAYPYLRGKDLVTLGEGWTPLVRFKEGVMFKLEFLNPTGSFKDRGASSLISAIRDEVLSREGFVAEDSSGNAGASIAAYSARAGIKARIYVPASASGSKVQQIEAYGAEIVKIEGNRQKLTETAMKEEEGKFYVGHVYHPAFRDGMRTLAYEIYEQLNWSAPDIIFLPVSAGTLLLGVIKGFKHLLSSGEIDEMPKIVACQSEIVSPVYHKLKGIPYSPPETIRSIADALISTNPPLLNLMVKELRSSGDAEVVAEDEILDAYHELALSGFYVEPSSAVAYAAYKKWLRGGKLERRDLTVVILTGHGLKSPLLPSLPSTP